MFAEKLHGGLVGRFFGGSDRGNGDGLESSQFLWVFEKFWGNGEISQAGQYFQNTKILETASAGL